MTKEKPPRGWAAGGRNTEKENNTVPENKVSAAPVAHECAKRIAEAINAADNALGQLAQLVTTELTGGHGEDHTTVVGQAWVEHYPADEWMGSRQVAEIHGEALLCLAEEVNRGLKRLVAVAEGRA
jgi:16S rRNA C1402 (ribose-2'-O) methylase RsmI